MTEVIPRLHIGNWQEARDAQMHVITVAVDAEFVGAEKFNLVDGPGNDVAVLCDAINAVVDAMADSQKQVLVHCVSGRSRSAAVLIGVLCRLRGLAFCEAYDLLISKYDKTRIHPALSWLLTKIIGDKMSRIRIVTGANTAFRDVVDFCERSAVRYCDKRDVQFFREQIPDDYPGPASWAKLDLIKRHLQFSEFVVWLDADAMVIGGSELSQLLVDATLNISTDVNGINCGVMAWKRCPESFAALDRMKGDYPKYADHPWFEQRSLMDFIDTLNVAYLPKEIFNAYPGDETPQTLFLHWPGMSVEERLPLMRAQAEKMNL